MLGQVTEVVDTAGRKTTMEYLPGGLLVAITYPDGRSTEYTYDRNKNVASQTSQDGYTLFYGYDKLGALTEARQFPELSEALSINGSNSKRSTMMETRSTRIIGQCLALLSQVS